MFASAIRGRNVAVPKLSEATRGYSFVLCKDAGGRAAAFGRYRPAIHVDRYGAARNLLPDLWNSRFIDTSLPLAEADAMMPDDKFDRRIEPAAACR